MMRINEIFYSIQGEGFWTGTPSVFIRFSGCNQRCDFCDTAFGTYDVYTVEDVMAAIRGWKCKRVVLTGGEPCLQLRRDLLGALRNDGYYIQVETNGSVDMGNLVHVVDWITVSRKALPVVLTRVDEVKRVYGGDDAIELDDMEKRAKWFYVQPKDTGDQTENSRITAKTIEFIKRNPEWRISLQTHKLLNVR